MPVTTPTTKLSPKMRTQNRAAVAYASPPGRSARAFSSLLFELVKIGLGRFQTRAETRPSVAGLVTKVAGGGFGQTFSVLNDYLEVLHELSKRNITFN